MSSTPLEPRSGAPAVPRGGLVVAAAAALALLVLFAYGGSLRGPFLFDDELNIVENPLIRDLDHLLPGGDPWASGASGAQIGSARARRVAYLSFALDHALWGLDPRAFRRTNLAVHLVAAGLLYLATAGLLRSPALRDSTCAAHARPLALAVTALWALHPIQTQAVSYVVQRMTSLSALFCLAALVAFQRSRAAVPTRRRAAWLGACVALLALAMLTKQNAAVFPLLLLLYEASFGDRARRPRRATLAALLLTIGLVPFVALRLVPDDLPVSAQLDLASRASTPVSRPAYLATQAQVVFDYLRLVVLPIGQSVDHDVRWATWGEARTLLCALLLAAAAVASLRASLRRDSPAAARVAGFGVSWFFLTLAVESSFLPIADAMVEHRLYLPSAGTFLAVVVLTTRFGESGRRRALVVLAALAIVLAVATRARNGVWTSALALWSDAAAKSPQKARVLYNLALALDGRDPVESRRLLERTLALDPEHSLARSALARRALDEGDLEVAEREFLRALEAWPGNWTALSGLAETACVRRERERTLTAYAIAARQAPWHRGIVARRQAIESNEALCAPTRHVASGG